MIKIVDRADYETHGDFFYPPFFIIEGDGFEIRPVRQEPYGYATPIGIFDNEGLAFIVDDKPTVTPVCLATSFHQPRASFFKDSSGRLLDIADYPKSCVDPRVIMARILTWWAFPEEDQFDVFSKALNPLPSITEANQWLVLNRFKGPNRLRDTWDGHWMDQGEKLKFVPWKIQKIHDWNMKDDCEEERARRAVAGKQFKPAAPPSPKEAQQNWNAIIKTYEQIEQKKSKQSAAKPNSKTGAKAKSNPKTPPTPKEARQNWKAIVKTYEQIEQKKKG